jgi:SAM-dependent methyltransferase
MNARQAFQAHDGRLIDKWAHYFPIYERHFAKFVGRDVRVLEIGVGHGGSLQLWKRYFGKRAEILGLDIDERCKAYEEEHIEIYIGDQANPPYFGPLDIVIDDGSHRRQDQEASYKALWGQVNPGGIYLIEDCHDGYPHLFQFSPSLGYHYPWVLVCEKPLRLVKGHPSRALNAAEIAAYGELT